MRCVASISYIVGVNDRVNAPILPSRGLRHDDPLNPYLFLICAEGFSYILIAARLDGRMKGASIGRKMLHINHLFFVDDCILFGMLLLIALR